MISAIFVLVALFYKTAEEVFIRVSNFLYFEFSLSGKVRRG